MGTRTKVTYCTSCCTEALCNRDNAAAEVVPPSGKVLIPLMVSTLCQFYLKNKQITLSQSI